MPRPRAEVAPVACSLSGEVTPEMLARRGLLVVSLSVKPPTTRKPLLLKGNQSA